MSRETFEFYTRLNWICALLNGFGFWLGFAVRWLAPTSVPALVGRYDLTKARSLWSAATTVGYVAVGLILVSYLGMGFIPAFADDPITAKYFAGEYQERYLPFAVPFRIGLILASVSAPLLLIRLIRDRRCRDFILLSLTLLLVALTLRRGVVTTTLLTVVLSYFAWRGPRWFVAAFGIFLIIFAFGSAANAFIAVLLGGDWEDFGIGSVAWGAPDIADQLWFLDRWMSDHWDYTYGLSVIGGLIPFHYEFAPSTLSKIVISGDALAPTGGFRLTPQILGYVAFGWMGAILFSIFHGFLSGLVMRIVKRLLEQDLGRDQFMVACFFSIILSGIPGFLIYMHIDVLVTYVVCAVLLTYCMRRLRDV